MIKSDPNPNHDRDSDHDNDNGKGTVVPTPAGGALTSLTALAAVLNGVDTASVTGRSGRPMLQFKSRESTWMFGLRRTIPEDGSRWAVNPMTFKWGFVCFSDTGKVVGEHLVPVSQPTPDITKLPDRGYPWQEQWAVDLKCISGTDAGTEVIFKMTTDGGIKAIAGLLDAVRDRLNGGQHDGKVAPILQLEKDSYPHPKHGQIGTPLTPIVDWMSLSGPAPAPKPTSPPPAEQPRRRRVA